MKFTQGLFSFLAQIVLFSTYAWPAYDFLVVLVHHIHQNACPWEGLERVPIAARQGQRKGGSVPSHRKITPTSRLKTNGKMEENTHERIFTILCARVLVLAGSATALAANTVDTDQSASYYPIPVEEYTYGDFDELRINKVYQLSLPDDPSLIPTEDFVRNGRRYYLLDMTRKDEGVWTSRPTPRLSPRPAIPTTWKPSSSGWTLRWR